MKIYYACITVIVKYVLLESHMGTTATQAPQDICRVYPPRVQQQQNSAGTQESSTYSCRPSMLC